MEDWRLLQRYAQNRSEDDFAALVERHRRYVYNMAVREVRDCHLAEDIAQAVFLTLAHKAETIRHGVVLESWLFTVTRFAAKNAIKQEGRRRHYEQRVGEEFLAESIRTQETAWETVEPRLNDSLAALNAKDRDAILLRYFQDLSLAEVGDALGVSPNTAQMRVARALEKLRKILSRHGAALTTAALASLLLERSSEAVPTFTAHAVTVSANGLFAPAAFGLTTTPSYTIYQGVLRTMNVIKFKAVAAIAVAVLTAGAIGSAVHAGRQISKHPIFYAASPGSRFAPLNIPLNNVPGYLSADEKNLYLLDQRDHHALWSTPFQSKLSLNYSLTEYASGVKLALTRDNGEVVWSNIVPPPSLVFRIRPGTQDGTLIDSKGHRLWSGKLALSGKPGKHSSKPISLLSDTYAQGITIACARDLVLLYRVGGNKAVVALGARTSTAADPDAQVLWSGRISDGGFKFDNLPNSVIYTGHSGAPAISLNGPISWTNHVEFQKATATIQDSASKTVTTEPVIVGSINTQSAGSKAPKNAMMFLPQMGNTIHPMEPHHTYTVTYKDTMGAVLSKTETDGSTNAPLVTVWSKYLNADGTPYLRKSAAP